MLLRENTLLRLAIVCWLPAMVFGQPAAADIQSTTVDLTVRVHAEVMQDMLYVNLQYRFEGADSDIVQQRINDKMVEVWRRATDVSSVRVRPGGYRVWYDDGKKVRRIRREPALEEVIEQAPKWIGYQSIRLDGEDINAVKALADELQALGLTMAGFGFYVSETLREETQNALMLSASTKLVSKARLLAQAFGTRLLAIEEIVLGGRLSREVYADMQIASAAREGGSRALLAGDPVMEAVPLILSGTAVTSRIEPD